MPRRDVSVRRAGTGDAGDLARLLHDFNTEFDDFVPEVPLLTERIAEHIREGHTLFWLAGEGPDGFASLRLRPSLISGAPDAYLEELYVVPALRGQGRGRALLEAVMKGAREHGAAHIDLGTSEDDVAARRLYESAGFTNREGSPDGPVMYLYEREL